MATNLPPGPELDRMACEALTRAGCAGWEPVEWELRGHHAGSTFGRLGLFRTREDAEVWQRKYFSPAELVIPVYPCVSTDWAVAGRALEAMRERGYLIELYGWPETQGDPYSVRIRSAISKLAQIHCFSGTGPHAIALAILAALEAPCE